MSRHFMVDPDNEDRLLKVPPHVVAEIRREAVTDCISAADALDWDGEGYRRAAELDGGDDEGEGYYFDPREAVMAALRGQLPAG